jgi:hypothetical protein
VNREIAMNYHGELLRHLPASGIAGGLMPVIQFAAERVGIRHTVHKKHQFRERVIALNAFITGINEVPARNESEAACLQDAMQERDFALKQLASLADHESRKSGRLRAANAIQRLFLLYAPSRPLGWPLR